jgi:hypothetical protein
MKLLATIREALARPFHGLRQHLIDDCRRWWTLWSLRMHLATTAAIGLLTLVPGLPAEVQAVIPAPYRALIVGIWAVAGFAARVIKQKPNV